MNKEMTMAPGDRLNDEADQFLTFLHLCEENPHRLYVPLKNMDGAYALASMAVTHKSYDDPVIFVNSGAPAVWPVDVATIAGADETFPAGTVSFTRVSTISPKVARQLGASLFSPKMVLEELIAAKPDGTAESGKAPCSLLGSKWVNAAPKRITGGDRDVQTHIGMALGIALYKRYEWSVWLGHAEGPRVQFPTDPTGAREAFRFRDLPPGRQRRAALRNWVEGHWRRRRTDDDEAKAWIKRHLRGATDFTWNGLRCRIQPPQFEIEQLQKQASSDE